VFWKITQSVVNSRLKRYVVPTEQQQDNESEKYGTYRIEKMFFNLLFS
jgi:hypothetical protein